MQRKMSWYCPSKIWTNFAVKCCRSVERNDPTSTFRHLIPTRSNRVLLKRGPSRSSSRVSARKSLNKRTKTGSFGHHHYSKELLSQPSSPPFTWLTMFLAWSPLTCPETLPTFFSMFFTKDDSVFFWLAFFVRNGDK